MFLDLGLQIHKMRVLDQQTGDTGSAVAIIQFCSMIAGATGMMLVSIRPGALISDLGIIQLSIGTIALVLWLIVKNKAYVINNLYKI